MTVLEEVILVNELDEVLGRMEKIRAHKEALLHRAFSVFIFDTKDRMLLQQRAHTKYHSGGLWTNACCSHPKPEEDTEQAVQRRLQEEIGFQTPVKKAFDFIYKASFENGLQEHEFDHVYIGRYDGPIQVNPNEVADYVYLETKTIEKLLKSTPSNFTAWFHLALPKVISWKEKYKQ